MYDSKTYETIKATMLNNIVGIDKREGSFTNEMLSPMAMELDDAYRALEKQLGVMFLTDTTSYYLERRGNEYGVNRKQGACAIGTATFSGTENTVIPVGTLVGTSTNLLFETIEEAIIVGDGIDVPVEATDIGAKYNVIEGTVTEIPIAVNGLSAVTNNIAMMGGSDVEDDEALLARIQLKIQSPATSGNAAHYRMWATEVNGVGDAKVFPLHEGPGTVMVLPITPGKHAIDAVTVANVLEHIAEVRPIGPAITIQQPSEVALNVSATLSISPNYTIQQIQDNYTKLFTAYVEGGVFKLYTIDFYKCLSFFYDIEGVQQVLDFKLNNGTSNINLQSTEIQVVGNITLAEQEG